MMIDHDPKPTIRADSEPHPEAVVAPGYLSNYASRVFNRLVDNRLRRHDLSLALIGPLLLLSWKGAMLQRDLVRMSAVKQPAMVALLDKLQAAGLIVRAASTTDKRAAMVDLTEEGQAAAATGRTILLEVNAEAVGDFTDTEAEQIVTLLSRFTANLEKLSQ